MTDIYAFLAEHAIPFEEEEHDAVFTCEESDKITLTLEGADTKNLFLTDKGKKNFYLVTVPHAKQVDLKALRHALGSRPLSFASAEKLQEYLGVTPGSATLLGLVHDTDHAVHFSIDSSIWEADTVLCHPLRNTATVAIPHEGVEKFLEVTGHEVNVLDVPERS